MLKPVFALLGLLAFGGNAFAIEDGRQIIRDPRFQNGIDVLQLGNGSTTVPVAFTIYSPFASPAGSPVWQLAQWNSQASFGQTGSYTSDGGYHWATADKDFTIYPNGGFKSAINSINEYQNYPNDWRPSGAPWVHFLLQQEMYNSANPGALESVAQMNKLNFSLDAQLLYNVRSSNPGYNSSIHASQFVMFLVVQNRNPASAGYGQLVWFSIPVYDDRTAIPTGACTMDPGTSSALYSIPYSAFGVSSVQGGSPVAFRLDILPWIKNAITCGAPYLTSQNQSDYYVSGMNYGWEMPGSNVSVMKAENLGLKVYSTGFPEPFLFGNATANAQWTLSGMSSNSVSGNSWILMPNGADPMMTSPAIRVDANRVKKLKIRAANDNNPADKSYFQIFWENEQGGFSEARSMTLPYSNGGGWGELNFNLSSNPNWTGTVTKIRLDPVTVGTGHAIGIEYISFEQ